MAASTTSASTVAEFSDKSNTSSSNSSSSTTITTTGGAADGNMNTMMSSNKDKDLEFQVNSRDEIQSALAKAVELRALHAAALQAAKLNSNSSRYPPPLSSPVSVSQAAARSEDYPVFTPSYNEDPLPAYYQAIAFQSRPLSTNWDVIGATDPPTGQLVLWDPEHQPEARSNACQLFEEKKSFAGSFADRSIAVVKSPHAEFIAKSSRRSSLADADTAVPFTDSNLSCRSQPRNRGMSLSWLFPRFTKKMKQQNKYTSENSNSQPASWIGSELAMVSAERLQKKLMEACESRDAALKEVSQMRNSLHELMLKLEQVEGYCQELRRALHPADQVKYIEVSNQLQNSQKHNTVLDSNVDRGMPVSEDVLIEGFLLVVSEARSSVKSFCKTLLIQIEESEDGALVDSINVLLQSYNLSVASKYSKLLLYHLEAIMNQELFQDFENCTFQKNGSQKLLDPLQQRQAQFASYMALQDLSWNDVLSKGTKYYSQEFSKFCDQKMSSIISLLSWTTPWPEQLLQAFFVASKRLWLLHLLAFSFSPPLAILRVEEHRSFDPHYMDDMLSDRVKARGPSRVKAMVMPGFYVKDKVLRCKVICKYKPISYD